MITNYSLLFSIRLIYITLPMCSSVHFHLCVDNQSFSDACGGEPHLSSSKITVGSFHMYPYEHCS